MNAKDFKIGEIYALRVGGQMHRFKIGKVVSVRYASPTSERGERTVSSLAGWDLDDGEKEVSGIEVAQIEGSYLQYKELVEKAEKEKQEAEARERARRHELERKRTVLYMALRQDIPPDPDDRNQLFKIGYGNRIEPSAEGWELLIKHLEAQQ